MLPFKVFEDFIDDDFVSKYLSNDGYTEASVSNNDGTTQATDEKVRRSRVRFYQHDQIPLADKLLKYYSAYFDEGEITHFEYQLTRYDDVDSGFFHMHDDTIRSNTPDIRKISCSIFMSDPDHYEGGEFVFRDYDLQAVRNWNKKYNCVMFPSSGLFHAVLPVKKGTRYSLVCWGLGPNPDYKEANTK